jgi:3-deoxy-manno-octulosonate cytidylyltransferase (CMP-KDO synthetase)
MYNHSEVTCIIPARIASTRFPGKLLKLLGEHTVLEHTYNSAKLFNGFQDVVIASGDSEISDYCRYKNLQYIDCFGDFNSGSERVLHAAQILGVKGRVVNLQADQPFIEKSDLSLLVNNSRSKGISTIIKPINSLDAIQGEQPVFTTIDSNNNILTFSRQKIPSGHSLFKYNLHIGIYLYSTEVLFDINIFHNCPWSSFEKLEQLEFLCRGVRFTAIESTSAYYEINTERDLINANNYKSSREFLESGK